MQTITNGATPSCFFVNAKTLSVSLNITRQEAFKLLHDEQGQGAIGDIITGEISWNRMPPGADPLTLAKLAVHEERVEFQADLDDVTVNPFEEDTGPIYAREDSNAVVTMTGAEGTVSAVAEARIKADEEHLRKVGIALPPPVYAPGSRVNSTGTANLMTSRQQWEEQPLVIPALEETARLIEAEDRQDLEVDVGALRMKPDGTLITGQQDLLVEGEGLRHLARMLKSSEAWAQTLACMAGGDVDDDAGTGALFPRGAALLAAMPSDLRADVFNRMVWECGAKGQRVALRTRKGPDGRSLFAVVGTRYTVYDSDKVARFLAEGLRSIGWEGARGPVVYDGRTTTLSVGATYHVDRVVDFAAGDVFKVGATFRSNDAAAGSIKGSGTAWRNLCLNLIIIGNASAPLFSLQHRGSQQDLISRFGEGMGKLDGMFDTFIERWGAMRAKPVSEVTLFGETFANVPDALAYLATEGRIDAGMSRDILVEHLLSAWGKEPGDSLADVVNAVTRMAHESLLSDIRRDMVERSAAALVPVFARAAQA